MIDIRPVGYVIGWLVAALGLSMILPLMADMLAGQRQRGGLRDLGHPHPRRRHADGARLRQRRAARGSACSRASCWRAASGSSSRSSARCPSCSARRGRASPTRSSRRCRRSPPRARPSSWASRPAARHAALARMLQWFGGLGIVVVAMVFLPALKVGGMQLFRSEAFDTLGKILPKAGEIAVSLTLIYVTLTFLCMMGYLWSGMNGLRRLRARHDDARHRRHGELRRLLRRLRRRAHYVGALFMSSRRCPSSATSSSSPAKPDRSGATPRSRASARDPGLRRGADHKRQSDLRRCASSRRSARCCSTSSRSPPAPATPAPTTRLGAARGDDVLRDRADRRLLVVDRLLGQDLPLPDPDRRGPPPRSGACTRRAGSSPRATRAGRSPTT
jgi:hypothetical protein